MKKGINLLQPEEIFPQKEKKAFFLKMGTIFLIIFYLLLVFGIFSYWFITQKELKDIVEKVNREQAKLNSLSEVESLQFFLKHRLSSLSKLMAVKKSDLKFWLNYLDSLTPPGLEIETSEWNREGVLEISGTANDALVFSNFLDNLKKAIDEKKVYGTVLSSATRQKEGIYTFNLEIQVKE